MLNVQTFNVLVFLYKENPLPLVTVTTRMMVQFFGLETSKIEKTFFQDVVFTRMPKTRRIREIGISTY